ncbi:hypothetical protein BpHYR1_054004 [Brachionus plicatilis]|uniref:Uncharacterized protein n=1 Tax=Brachionus plicatilis TaxID=10195 RepID=A0A3M7PUV4_BRAPC|nr:hypothetical protein BpHYR1_054004 [Brachionus plicatilis]
MSPAYLFKKLKNCVNLLRLGLRWSPGLGIRLNKIWLNIFFYLSKFWASFNEHPLPPVRIRSFNSSTMGPNVLTDTPQGVVAGTINIAASNSTFISLLGLLSSSPDVIHFPSSAFITLKIVIRLVTIHSCRFFIHGSFPLSAGWWLRVVGQSCACWSFFFPSPDFCLNNCVKNPNLIINNKEKSSTISGHLLPERKSDVFVYVYVYGTLPVHVHKHVEFSCRIKNFHRIRFIEKKNS